MTKLASIQDYIKQYAARIEHELAEVVPQQWEVPTDLRESMHYSLMAGGKRLRPVLVVAAAEAAGGSTDAAVSISCAIEMVHTYSLIHDDLPAMDNDDFRRGRPTNHKVFGEAMAILAGDGLLTQAFYQLVRAARRHRIASDVALDIVEDLAQLAGPYGMVGGQAADMKGEQGLTKLEDLTFIHRHKTSDLIVFSLKAGGRLAGATAAQLDALEAFGYDIGMAFQIRDDILDLVGDEQKLGKPVQSDVKSQKVTYPYFVGLEASQQEMEKLTARGKDAVRQAGFARPERLLEIADYLMNRDH